MDSNQTNNTINDNLQNMMLASFTMRQASKSSGSGLSSWAVALSEAVSSIAMGSISVLTSQGESPVASAATRSVPSDCHGTEAWMVASNGPSSSSAPAVAPASSSSCRDHSRADIVLHACSDNHGKYHDDKVLR